MRSHPEICISSDRTLRADLSVTPVTVTTSIEDELTALYAERDENTQREDFSPAMPARPSIPRWTSAG